MVLNCIQCPIHCENSKKYKNDIERYKKEIENYKKDKELSDKKLLEMLQENQVLKDQVHQKAELIHKYATNISKSRKELIMKPQVKLLRAVSQVEKHQSIIEGDVLTMRVAIQGIKQNCDNCKEKLEKEREDIKKNQEDLLNRNINLEHICSQQQHKISHLEKEVNRLESLPKIPNTKKSANTSDSLSSFPPTPTPSNTSSDESCDLSPHLSGSLESVFAIPHGIEQAGIVKTCSSGKVDMSNDLKGAPEQPYIIPLQPKDKVCPDNNQCNISYLDSSRASNRVKKEKGKKSPEWNQILLAKKPRKKRKLGREINWVKIEPSSEERSRLKGEDENACNRDDNITDDRMVVTRNNNAPPIAKYGDVEELPVPCNAMTDSLTLGVEVKEQENKAQNNGSSLGRNIEKIDHSSLQVKSYESFKQPSTPGYSPKLNDFESICKFLLPPELIKPIDQNKDALQFKCAKDTSNQIIDKVSTEDTATTAVNKKNDGFIGIESHYNPLNVQPKISKSIFSPVSLTEGCSDYRDKRNECIINQPASENFRQVIPDPDIVERKPLTHSENSPSRLNLPSVIIEPLEKDINTAATVVQPKIAKKTEADHDSSLNHFESEDLSDVEIPDKIMNSVLAEDLNISELSCIDNLGDSSIDEGDLKYELSETITDTNYVSNTKDEKNCEFPMKVMGFPILSHETDLKDEKLPQNLEANENTSNIDNHHTDFNKHNNSHQGSVGTMQANSVEIPWLPLNDEQSNADLSQSVQNQYLNSNLSQRSPFSQNHYFMRNVNLPNYSEKKIKVNQSKSNNNEPNRQKSPSPTLSNSSSSASPYKTPGPSPPFNSEHQLSPNRRANNSPPPPRSPGSLNHYSMRTLSPTSYCGSPNRSPRAQCKSPRSPSSPPPLAIHYRGFMRNVKHNEDDCTCNQFSSLVKCSRHTAIENFFTPREKRGLPKIEEVNEVISVPINEQLSISITDSTGPKEYSKDSICDFNVLPTLLLVNELNEPDILSEKASIVEKSTSSLTSGMSCTSQGVKTPCLRQVTKTYSSNRAERTQKKQLDQNSVDNFCSWKLKNTDCISAELTNLDDASSITITDTTFNEKDIFPLISNKLISFHSCLQRYRFRPMRTKPFLTKAALRRNILAPRNNSFKPFTCKKSTKHTDLIRPYVNRLKQLLLLDTKVNSTDSRERKKLNGEEKVSCSDEVHSVGLNRPIVATDIEMPNNVKKASLVLTERHKQLNEVQEVSFSKKKLHANDWTSLNPIYDTALTLSNTCESFKGEQLKGTNICQQRQISSGLVESKLNSIVTDIEMLYHVSFNKGTSLPASNQNKEFKDAQDIPSSDEKLKSSFGAFTIPRVDLGCMSLDQTQIFCGTDLNKLNSLKTINKTNIINHKMTDHVLKTTINLTQEDNEIGAVHGTSFSEKRNSSDLACHISNTDLSCVDFDKSETDHEDFNNCQTVNGSEIFDEKMPEVSDCKKTKLVSSDDDMSMFNRNKPSIPYPNSSQYNLDFQALNHCLTEDEIPVIKENKKVSRYERNNKKEKNEPNNQKVLKSFSKLEHNQEIKTERKKLDKIKPIHSYNQVGSIEKQYHQYQNSLAHNKLKAEYDSVESLSKHTDLESTQLKELDMEATVNKDVMKELNHQNGYTPVSVNSDTKIIKEIPDIQCLPEEHLPVAKGKRRVSRYEINSTKNELSDQTFLKLSAKDEHNTKIKTIQKPLDKPISSYSQVRSKEKQNYLHENCLIYKLKAEDDSIKSLSSHADLESTKLKELNQSDHVMTEVKNVSSYINNATPISVNPEKTCNDVSKCMKRAGHVNSFNGKDSKTINGLSLKKSHISICKAMTILKNDQHKVSEIIHGSGKRTNYKKFETKNVSAPISPIGSITDKVSKSANGSTLQHSINDSISVHRNTYVQTQNNKPMKCLHEKRQMLPSPSSSFMDIQKDQVKPIQEVAVRSEDSYVMLNPKINPKIAIRIATRQYQNRRKLSTTLSKSLDTKLPKNLDQCNSFKYGKTEPCNNKLLRPNDNLKKEEKSESHRIKTLQGNPLMERFRTLDENSPINKNRTAVSTCQTSSYLQCKRKSVPEVSTSKSPIHPKKICLIDPLPLNQSKRKLNYGLETSCMKQLPIRRHTSIHSSLSCSKIELHKTGKVRDLLDSENYGKKKTDQLIAEKVVHIPEENKPSASGTEEMVTGYESIKQCQRVKLNARELTNTKPIDAPIVENSCARETTDMDFDDDYVSDDGLVIDFKNDCEIPNGAKCNPQTLFNVESKYKGEINVDYCPRNTSLTPSNGQTKIIPKVEVFPKGEIKFNQEHVDRSFSTTSSLNIVQPDNVNREKCELESPRLEPSDISSFMPKFYTEQRDEVASGVTKTDKREDLNTEESMHEYIAKLKYTRKKLNELIPKGDKITVNGNIIRAAMKVHSGSIQKYAEKNISEKRKTTPKLQQGGHKPGHMDEVLKVLRLFVREHSSSMVKIEKTADELKNYEIHILLSGLLRTLEEEIAIAFNREDNDADIIKEIKRASWIINVSTFADILPTHKKGTPLLHPRLKTFVALLVLIKESLPAERKMNFFSEVLGHFESYFLKYKLDEGGKLEHPSGVMMCVAMLYGTMARLEGAMCRVRRTIFDVFYCTTKLAHTLSYALLIVWPDVLPRKPIEAYYDDPLGLVLVHALTTCPLVNSDLASKFKKNNKISPANVNFERLLKHMALRYGFSGGTTSANHIFALFAAQFDREFVHEAIVLLCKRRGLDWFKHWPLGTLLNMLRRWHQGSGVTDVVAAAIVNIFGSVVRSFDGKTTADFQTLFELLKEILSDGTSPQWMQEHVIVNLCQMSRFNKGLCWGLVASWRPLEPVSADVIDKILLEIVSRCPKKFWLMDNRAVIYLK